MPVPALAGGVAVALLLGRSPASTRPPARRGSRRRLWQLLRQPEALEGELDAARVEGLLGQSGEDLAIGVLGGPGEEASTSAISGPRKLSTLAAVIAAYRGTSRVNWRCRSR